jgi:hypothetical protein
MGIRLKILRQLFNPWFIFFVAVFFAHQWAAANDYSHWLLRSYLGDLLAIPVLLHLITVSIRLVLNNSTFRADWVMLLSLWIVVAIVFEGILPYYYARYTQDYIDLLVYALGLLLALVTVYRT